MTKLVVAGSRSIDSYGVVSFAIEDADLCFGPLDEIVHGGARGVDSLAQRWADEHSLETTVFEPEYEEYDNRRYAPIARNAKMADYGNDLVAVWDGESSGTRSMIEKALDNGLNTIVRVVE